MCNAGEYPQLSHKMGMTDRGCLSYVLPTKKEKVKEKINSLKERKIHGKESNKTGDCQTCQESKMDSDIAGDKENEKKKKKEWKSVPVTDLGFNLSLLPRPTRPELIDPEEEARIINKIENELEEYDNVVDKYRDFDTTETELFEENCKKKDKLSRSDTDRKVRKAGKQVKDKYNNNNNNINISCQNYQSENYFDQIIC